MASSWEIAWPDRPREEAALFNPAFCGEAIARTVAAYCRARPEGLPLALAFLVLPLTLSSPLRELIPRRSDATFLTWTGAHAVPLAALPERTRSLRPVTREALLFHAQIRSLRITGTGVVEGDAPLRPARRPDAGSEETGAIRSAASALGRWFAQQHSAGQIMQALGMRP